MVGIVISLIVIMVVGKVSPAIDGRGDTVVTEINSTDYTN